MYSKSSRLRVPTAVARSALLIDIVHCHHSLDTLSAQTLEMGTKKLQGHLLRGPANFLSAPYHGTTLMCALVHELPLFLVLDTPSWVILNSGHTTLKKIPFFSVLSASASSHNFFHLLFYFQLHDPSTSI